MAYICEKEGFDLREFTNLSIRQADMVKAAKNMAPSKLEIPEAKSTKKSVKPLETKEIQLVVADPSKTTKIGGNLDDK